MWYLLTVAVLTHKTVLCNAIMKINQFTNTIVNNDRWQIQLSTNIADKYNCQQRSLISTIADIQSSTRSLTNNTNNEYRRQIKSSSNIADIKCSIFHEQCFCPIKYISAIKHWIQNKISNNVTNKLINNKNKHLIVSSKYIHCKFKQSHTDRHT